MSDAPRQVGVVLFDGFELLDVFGPLEILGVLPSHFQLNLIGPAVGPVRSAQGPQVVAGYSYGTAPHSDIALIPGGIGTRTLVNDTTFIGWLGRWASQVGLVSSVCTGSGLLAAAGLLDGYRATSNKRSFTWATEQSALVDWVATARWVEDRDRWTSSGVAAGMDMTLALVAHFLGEALATKVAEGIELEWHRVPSWDPFAALNGLAPT
ncbi:MAG: DJ-1/PfpI family protein [Acidimicrobiia bacterium]